MNISTVASPTDTDIKVPGFHQSAYINRAPDAYLLMTHEQPRNPRWTKRLEASPWSGYDHLTPEQAAAMIVPGYVWGDDEGDPEERKGEYVFTSLGLHKFVGYEIDTAPGLTREETFTGVFRKIEVNV